MNNVDKECRSRLRQMMRQRRSALSTEEVKIASGAVAERLSRTDALIKARVIMGYSAVHNEVDLSCFLQAQARMGKVILLPRVNREGGLEAVRFTGPDCLEVSKFGIPEPRGSEFPRQDIDAVLVPGLVFDPDGYRLGYGKGYYDRFLSSIKTGLSKCGVGYQFQVVDSVYPQQHDVPLDRIVTDETEIVIEKVKGF